MPHLFRHGTSVFVVSSERTDFYGKQGVPKTYSPRNALFIINGNCSQENVHATYGF